MILVNGVAIDTIPASDRGFAYGDGVFRTLVVRDGQPRAWRRQFGKLAFDAHALGIPCPEEALLREETRQVAGEERSCAVRIVVTRGSGPRGYASPAPVRPMRSVSRSPFPQHPAEWIERGVTARVCALRLGWQPALAGIKHLNRLENVLARAEWDDPGIAEGLLQDCAGNVIGGTMSNVFVVEGERIATPDLSQCGVAGVTRDRVMDGARRRRVACVVERISLERLLAAQEVMLVNSLIGVWQVRRLGGRAWDPGTVTAQVRRWLDEDGD
ncbi:MAG: aminodeoxychorismate lyase [Betaproteobacteria bacterium RIFCSPLOWO2_02_64_14]|nr:MAG: aminodeoxychorismate lyase [Betaproteobacteria bacterium RIFCSPLOWO2_02_64_14]